MKVLIDSQPAMEQTGLTLLGKGKVREVYDLGENLLIVTTDRLSAFDVTLPTGIPYKGAVLNSMSAFAFEQTADICPNHFVKVVEFAKDREFGLQLPEEVVGRSMIVRKTNPLPVEAIVRGYITGSGWSDYCNTGRVSGILLPTGLQESEELAEPLFTPSDKAPAGQHDQAIGFADVVALVGEQAANEMRARSLAVYKWGCDFAREKGIIIADTKFEFGWLDDEVILIDEALTPDSSRFWPADQFEVGHGQPSFDKQYVRDYLTSIDWNKEPPAPDLPDEVVANTSAKYLEACQRITGSNPSKSDFGF